MLLWVREGEEQLFIQAAEAERDGKGLQLFRVINNKNGNVLACTSEIGRWKIHFEDLMNEKNKREWSVVKCRTLWTRKLQSWVRVKSIWEEEQLILILFLSRSGIHEEGQLQRFLIKLVNKVNQSKGRSKKCRENVLVPLLRGRKGRGVKADTEE